MVSQVMRRRDWRSRLSAALDQVAAAPFDWGRHDCLTGLLHAVTMAVIDTDCTFMWRGRYRSARGALRVLRNDGFAGLADLAASILPEIHPSAATDGDIAAIPTDDGFGHALGIVIGPQVMVMSPAGLAPVPRDRIDRAFKV